ncbi:protein of unknown function [Microterricola viridarii]|uniref:DUF4166 domain-containing protein n=2 Tax=Microterricola viridarii TaxID=412690 RepID=A0A1H1U762_9MICO|nr:protein of unknown function [Microterricola viridarii]
MRPAGGSSPYEAVLGERMQELHPRLRAYFAAIPPGWHGWGSGVFDTAGTPRRWLRPVLRALHRQGILLAGWQRDVPFTVRNEPGERHTVRAVRCFHLHDGEWAMVDVIGLNGRGRLIDRLGHAGLVEAEFAADVAGGALRLHSTRVTLCIGRLRLRVPRFLAPTVLLTERWDDAEERQVIALTMTAPLLGTLYEYGGSFRYEVRQGEGQP